MALDARLVDWTEARMYAFCNFTGVTLHQVVHVLGGLNIVLWLFEVYLRGLPSVNVTLALMGMCVNSWWIIMHGNAHKSASSGLAYALMQRQTPLSIIRIVIGGLVVFSSFTIGGLVVFSPFTKALSLIHIVDCLQGFAFMAFAYAVCARPAPPQRKFELAGLPQNG